MPKAVVVSAALEAEFKEAFVNEGWNETIIKINILSREWDIHSPCGKWRNYLPDTTCCYSCQAKKWQLYFIRFYY